MLSKSCFMVYCNVIILISFFCAQQLHNAAVAKARTLMRGKNRDKRNAWNVD